MASFEEIVNELSDMFGEAPNLEEYFNVKVVVLTSEEDEEFLENGYRLAKYL